MKKPLLAFLILFCCLNTAMPQELVKEKRTNSSIGISVGYDIPEYKFNFSNLDYTAGLSLGLNADFKIYKSIFLGIDFQHIQNKPKTLISNEIRYPLGLSTINVQSQNVYRNYLGLIPKIKLPLYRNKLNLELSGSAGISYFSGGDIAVSSTDPSDGVSEIHMLQAGYQGLNFAYKINPSINYYFTNKIGLHLEGYYLNHRNVHSDNSLSFSGLENVNIIYGSNDFDISNDEYAISDRDALAIQDEYCGKVTSFGMIIGLRYKLGETVNETKKTVEVEELAIPKKIIITVQDGPSNKMIPGADVIIKNLKGQAVATGTTNNYGLIEFNTLKEDTYTIEAKVYGIDTEIKTIQKVDFEEQIIRKTLLHEDLRFIVKGVTTNKKAGYSEPGVVVNLTNLASRQLKQNNSNGKGQFSFQLDPNSSYELVGVKENRLSDIDKVSTIGLNRSTTLFVELQLGLDDFDCGRGTVLDIKYEYDKATLLSESKFELNRLIQYMKDHQSSIVELSAHTDSRGTREYNLSLSDKRSSSAVDYIISNGIPRSRIIAQGYGESRPLNNCVDGVNCSEAEHSINRRTEAKLLCNQ